MHEIVCADAFEHEISHRFPLVICDPPYGKIVKEKWDVANYTGWFNLCASICTLDATVCMWGGIGKPQARPFLTFLATVEHDSPGWTLKNLITWRKKRAYGVKDNYLFTREECAILTRGKPTFNVPYLDEVRGYAGYNKKYPAKSALKRRNNVWMDVDLDDFQDPVLDITELFRGKIHPTQKPRRLYEILIETHSNEGDDVADLCAGSCVTARAAEKLGRGYYCVEREEKYLRFAVPDRSR